MIRLILLLALFPGTCFSQYLIEGYVLDDQSGDPLPFVSVVLTTDQQKGVLTNELGQYRIELDSLQRRRGTLSFSLLSFAAKEIYLGDDNAPGGADPFTLNVRLASSFLELPEIVVLSDLALRGIVRRAVERIPQNYGADNYLLRAYSRAYAVNDATFSSLSEAYVTVEDHPYGRRADDKWRDTKAWIDQLRTSGGSPGQPARLHPFFDRQSFLVAPYTWMSNPLRKGSIGTFSFKAKDDLSHLTFRRLGEYVSGPDTLVRIRCDIHPDLDDGAWPGPGDVVTELLINRTDFAIVEYRNWTRGKSIYKDATYRKVRGNYYLERASFSWEMESDFYGDIPHVYSTLFYVTDVITDRKEIRKIKRGRRLVPSEQLTTLNLKHRPEYWRGEERMVQLPARDNLRIQLKKILAPGVERADSLSKHKK